MADTLNMVSIISFVLTGIFLIVSILLFFVLKIPLVLNYLSGKNVKSIKTTKENKKNTKGQANQYNNISEGTRNYQNQEDLDSDDFDGKTGILTDNDESEYEEEKTGILGNQTDVFFDNDATTQLRDEQYNKPPRDSSIVFEYIDDVMLIHTNEVIT